MAKRKSDIEEGKHVGIWIRVSTEDQAQGDSPEHHEKRARLYAEAKAWTVLEVYRLEAVSGKAVAEHPEAKRMVADVKRGHVTGLIFSKLARLARNTKELLEFADFFHDNGADLVSLGESIDTSSPAGRLFYTMIAAMAQWEREEIAARVAASVPIRAKLGKPLGGQSPFGFIWKDSVFTLETKEAPIRKLMYELFLTHRRKKTVARLLNEYGYRTRVGAAWSDTTIDRLLRDPTAKGVRISNYTKNVGKSKPIALKPESDWVYHDCERIVSDELWGEVNAILDAQRQTGKRPAKRAVHLFAGKAFCGCGGKLYVHTSNKSRYVCQACRNKIPIVDLEGIVHEQLRTYAVSPDEIRKHLDAGQALIQQKEELIGVLQAERNKIAKQQNTLIDLYQAGGLPKEDFGPRYQPLADRIRQIDEELPALEASRDVLKINSLSAEEVMSAATDLYTRWPTLSREEQRSIVEAIIDRITVGKDDVAISLLLSDNSPPNAVEMATHSQRRVAFLPGVPLTLKSLRKKDYSDEPKTLGEHLKKRRKELGLLQREVAARMGILAETYANWEKGKTKPVASQFRPVVEFLGFDPTPAPTSLRERLQAKRRSLGASFAQIARYLAWDQGTLTRYLNGTWAIPRQRMDQLEALLAAEHGTIATAVLSLRRKR